MQSERERDRPDDVLIPLEQILEVLPKEGRARLLRMGWGAPEGPREIERSLRRAIGAPQRVGLTDLELDPERYHGAYVSTTGLLSMTERPGVLSLSLGRLWVEVSLLGAAPATLRRLAAGRVRLGGIVLADPKVRAAHRARQKEPGGYGAHGIFIAALVAVSLTPETGPGLG